MTQDEVVIALTRMTTQLDSMRTDQLRLEVCFHGVKKEISEIHDAANRWRGGFLVILAIGGMIGWVAAIAPNFMKFMGK